MKTATEMRNTYTAIQDAQKQEKIDRIAKWVEQEIEPKVEARNEAAAKTNEEPKLHIEFPCGIDPDLAAEFFARFGYQVLQHRGNKYNRYHTNYWLVW